MWQSWMVTEVFVHPEDAGKIPRVNTGAFSEADPTGQLTAKMPVL